MNVLAISGSLRQASINSALCRVAARLAPAPLRVSVFAGMGSLPLFNPDLEERPPAAVQQLRCAVSEARALIIASPEYAHGISGVLKNALDWLVSDEAIVGKPVVLVNASPRAHHALAALQEVLQTMSTRLVGEASVSIPLLGGAVTEEAMLAALEVRHAIEASLGALARHLSAQEVPGASTVA